MSARKKALLVAVGLCAGAIVVPPGVAGAARTIQDVFVTNTPDNPVPVSGSVNVGNLPETQAVTGSIELTNPVTVAGTVPVVVAFPTDRFSSSASLDIGEGSGNGCINCDDAVLLDVPDGKIAVIDHVSMQMRSTPGAVFNVTLSAASGGFHYVESEYLDTDDLDRRTYMGSHAITLAAPSVEGQEGEVAAHAFSIGGLALTFRMTAQVVISGYYVDAPV